MNRYLIASIILNVGLLIGMYTINEEANEYVGILDGYYHASGRAIEVMRKQEEQIKKLKTNQCVTWSS